MEGKPSFNPEELIVQEGPNKGNVADKELAEIGGQAVQDKITEREEALEKAQEEHSSVPKTGIKGFFAKHNKINGKTSDLEMAEWRVETAKKELADKHPGTGIPLVTRDFSGTKKREWLAVDDLKIMAEEVVRRAEEKAKESGITDENELQDIRDRAKKGFITEHREKTGERNTEQRAKEQEHAAEEERERQERFKSLMEDSN